MIIIDDQTAEGRILTLPIHSLLNIKEMKAEIR
jgi:hypothetical protein